MEIMYTKKEDYLYPNLMLQERPRVKLGRYARMRLKYIKSEMKAFYQELLMKDELTDYLLKIEAEATEMEIRIINYMKKTQKVDEELKAKDQMKWVGMMNCIANSAQETVLNKIIYSYRTN